MGFSYDLMEVTHFLWEYMWFLWWFCKGFRWSSNRGVILETAAAFWSKYKWAPFSFQQIQILMKISDSRQLNRSSWEYTSSGLHVPKIGFKNIWKKAICITPKKCTCPALSSSAPPVPASWARHHPGWVGCPWQSTVALDWSHDDEGEVKEVNDEDEDDGNDGEEHDGIADYRPCPALASHT